MKMGGLILAGGRSSRFGSEKAVADLAHGVMMDVPLRALRGVCAAVAVSVRAGSVTEAYATTLGLPTLPDGPGDFEGPLAGIRHGLVWADANKFDLLAVAPCDSPTLQTAHYECLYAAMSRGATAVIGVSRGGREPLTSIWPVIEGIAAIEVCLRDGVYPPVHRVLASINAVPVKIKDYDGLNVNFRRDLPTT